MRSAPHRRGRPLIIFAVSTAVAVILAVWTLWPKHSIDEIELAVTELGFHPVRPASKLRGPGSIYVAEDNHFYHQVCRAQAADLGDSVQTSPSALSAISCTVTFARL